MIKAIVFDCFGVLIADGFELFVERLEKTNPEARKFIFDTIRQSNAGLIEPAESNRIINEYLEPIDPEWRQKVSTGEVKNSDLMAWVKELRGSYKTALLSNTGKGSLTRRFAEGELEEIFDEIVVSAELGVVKPDPAIYRITADRLGVETTECAFFDDRQHHVDGGTAAGMHAFLFTTLAQAKTDIDKLLSSS